MILLADFSTQNLLQEGSKMWQELQADEELKNHYYSGDSNFPAGHFSFLVYKMDLLQSGLGHWDVGIFIKWPTPTGQGTSAFLTNWCQSQERTYFKLHLRPKL